MHIQIVNVSNLIFGNFPDPDPTLTHPHPFPLTPLPLAL